MVLSSIKRFDDDCDVIFKAKNVIEQMCSRNKCQISCFFICFQVNEVELSAEDVKDLGSKPTADVVQTGLAAASSNPDKNVSVNKIVQLKVNDAKSDYSSYPTWCLKNVFNFNVHFSQTVIFKIVNFLFPFPEQSSLIE